MKGKALPLIMAGCILVLDQATKAIVDASLRLHDTVVVIPGLFHIGYVRNPGAAFGFLAGSPPLFRRFFFVAVTLAAIGLILYYLIRSRRQEVLTNLSLSLILAGAAGNLIDRIRYGEVIDFLEVIIGSYHWPNFNVADAAISTGAVLLCFDMLRKGKGGRPAA